VQGLDLNQRPSGYEPENGALITNTLRDNNPKIAQNLGQVVETVARRFIQQHTVAASFWAISRRQC
jgi:hypothetical protein